MGIENLPEKRDKQRNEGPLSVEIDEVEYPISNYYKQNIKFLIDKIEELREVRARSGIKSIIGLNIEITNMLSISGLKKSNPDAKDVTPLAYRGEQGTKHLLLRNGERKAILEFENDKLRVVQFLLKTDPSVVEVKDTFSRSRAHLGPAEWINEYNQGNLLILADWSPYIQHLHIYLKQTEFGPIYSRQTVISGLLSIPQD